ncbi:MAG: HlyD family efflux transporter periplasmic adaptor subunit [Deltaproteobacteria bacterium]|nr:HlyD family efflux transporter periplasmic adaptor subunit [Deltaproteobacteria bacterium]
MTIESSLEAAHRAGADGIAGAAPADWIRLAETGPIEAWCASWLRIQSDWIGDVTRSAVCRCAGEGQALEWLACSSDEDRDALRHLAEATIAEARGLAGPTQQGQGRFGVSYHAKLAGEACLVVAVEVEREGESDLARVLRQIQWGAAWLERRLGAGSSVETLEGHAGPAQAHQVLDLIALALEAESFGGAAQSLVTQLARLLVCDRVSLGIEEGGRMKLVVLSHIAAFGREMNLVRAIESAMQESRDQHATLLHPPLPGDAPLILREHESLSREHGAGTVLTIPIQRTGSLRGALTFEHAEADAFSSERIAVLESIALALAPILELWRRDDRSLVRKIADAGRVQLERVIGPGHLTRKIVLAAIALVVLFFAFAKGDYRVGAEGVLEGASRRVVIAPFDGYVAAAHHRAGDFVTSGDELARLDDRELELERLKWSSRLVQLQRQSDESRAAREYGRTSILVAQIEEAGAEIARLEERLARTRVTAAFDGLVVSGDLSQSLGAAVSRGDVLFEIAPLDRYRILLEVDEEQISDVAVGLSGTLLLAAMPEDPVQFEVTKLTPVATPEEGHNFFRVEGTLLETSERLRPGMEGVGKIDVDRRHLIWIWTRGFQNWLRLWVWSWWP